MDDMYRSLDFGGFVRPIFWTETGVYNNLKTMI